jgi:hypothetical protein
MTSNSNFQNISMSNNKSIPNPKDDSDLSSIDNSDLYLFLQFYFRDATKNLKKILSDNVITNESEIPKITSSFNFWLNFALNFKDNSFVDLLLNKSDKAKFCREALREILEEIVKFLFEHFSSEQAFNKIMKNNYNKIFEVMLRLKDIVDNVYESALRNEIFINIKEEDEKSNLSDNSLIDKRVATRLIRPNIINNDDEVANNQFKENGGTNNIENVINNNNININNIKIINNNQGNINENLNIENSIESTDNKQKDNNNKMIIENGINNENIQENGGSMISENEDKKEIEEITPYTINEPSLDYEEIKKLFHNFCYFTNFNLRYFQIVFYEKVGYAFLDYNGNFLWADNYTSYILFEEENIKKINLFNIMTDFSKYILKKKYKDKFFDFQDENNRMRVFTYTIDGSKIKEKEAIKKQEKLYEELNKIKTLVSRATPVLLTGQEGTFIACIFLETKFSFYRQNFDFFYWKSDWNNQ